jgi:sugar O-acyltransferase (sialic acid O-acetyltransferase NeuD family)
VEQNKKILLLGAGGHCQSVADSLLDLSIYQEIGLVGKAEAVSSCMGLAEVGKEEDLEKLFRAGYTDAFISLGSIGDTSVRRRIYRELKRIGFNIPNIIDQSSIVSSRARLGEGIYVGKRAVINACTQIGSGAIINTGSIVEHSCWLGDFAHIAPGSVICGDVYVGESSHIGAGSVVKQGRRIGSHTMIGMGSIVLQDIGDEVTAYGNPCRPVSLPNQVGRNE